MKEIAEQVEIQEKDNSGLKQYLLSLQVLEIPNSFIPSGTKKVFKSSRLFIGHDSYSGCMAVCEIIARKFGLNMKL